MLGNVTLPFLGEPYHVTSLFTLFSQSDERFPIESSWRQAKTFSTIENPPLVPCRPRIISGWWGTQPTQFWPIVGQKSAVTHRSRSPRSEMIFGKNLTHPAKSQKGRR